LWGETSKQVQWMSERTAWGVGGGGGGTVDMQERNSQENISFSMEVHWNNKVWVPLVHYHMN